MKALSNNTEDKVVFPFDTYALQLQDITPDSFKGQTFSVDLGSVQEAMTNKDGIKSNSLRTSEMIMRVLDNSTAAVQLPENFLSDTPECTTGQSGRAERLSYSVFLTDILFQTRNENASDIGSVIVSTRLSCARNRSLSTPIITHFRTSEEVCCCFSEGLQYKIILSEIQLAEHIIQIHTRSKFHLPLF